MGVDLDGVRKEKLAVGSRIGQLKEKVKALDAEIKSLQDDLEAITVKRDKAFENIKSLRQLRDDGVCLFYFRICCSGSNFVFVWLFFFSISLYLCRNKFKILSIKFIMNDLVESLRVLIEACYCFGQIVYL